ncbi:MAG TPA: hypothetical protein VML75_28660, partial [Kofleriaceae bacterium]|nr:hypothetical protein [Kofleriaceae bacterium]
MSKLQDDHLDDGTPTTSLGAAANEPADDLIGTFIGGYRLAARIGRGGMGAVYLAFHPTLGKRVAIKV